MMIKKMIAIILTLIFAIPASTLADEYVLVKGKGIEVCEDYGKNLNYFKPKISMKYKRQISLDFKDFSKPMWLNWDPILMNVGERMFRDNNQALFDEIDLFLWERDINPFMHVLDEDKKNWHGTKMEYEKAWRDYKVNRRAQISKPIGQLDIDNDGMPENIVYDKFYERGIFLVLTADKKSIDIKKTANLLQHPPRKTDGKWSFALYGSIMYAGGHKDYYDAFIYKGKTYFDWWESECDPIVGRLRVFKTENQKTEEICIYQYVFHYE